MLVVTTNEIPGKEIEALGLVQGSMILTQHLGRDLGAAFKNLVGGELKQYNEMMMQARDTALERMCDQASKMGADAIVAIRFSTSSIMQNSAEFVVYGTAVKYVG